MYECCVLQYGGWNESSLTEAMSDVEINDMISTHIIYCSHVLGLSSGQTAILANGRVSYKIYVADNF